MQHRYPEMMIAPMRAEITEMGAIDLRTPEDVDAFVAGSKDGTALLVVNSVCGCSAGTMRPGLRMALDRIRPDSIGQVFAGADLEATARARQLFEPHPPSSPAIALFRDGELVFMLERQHIQGQMPERIASALAQAVEANAAA
jgi:putative YphP/YqiW family bacilliredoxin